MLTASTNTTSDVPDTKGCEVPRAWTDTTFDEIDGVGEALLGLLLGKHERRMLLQAASYEAKDGASIAPDGCSAAAVEAHRRAIRRVRQAGLVWTCGWSIRTTISAGQAWRGWIYRVDMTVDTWRTQVLLTPLGMAVVQVLRKQLESEQPIRWNRHLAAIAAVVRENQPMVERVDREREAERKRIEAELARIRAMFGR
jgi:hypothetical protein